MAAEDTLRLFFALPCPPEQAAAICSWRDRQALGGRPVALENLHLTLAFLGAQPAEHLNALRQLAAGVVCDEFELTLDRLITLGKDFLCLTPTEAPPALLQLAGNLAERLSTLGVVLDSRPYLPHMTLARQAHVQAQCAAATFSWKAERFVLYQSQNTTDGVRYQELGSWPMRAPEATAGVASS